MQLNLSRTVLVSLSCLCLLSSIAVSQEPGKPLLHPLFSDHMVLQRDKPIAVWGWASPGESVQIQFANLDPISTKADETGKWKSQLGPLSTCGQGTTLRISTSTQDATIKDVLVGEVWICSGQSNMEWSVQASKDAATEIANADHPNIRLFTAPRRIASQPQALVDGQWQSCSPQTVSGFSAVGYYFGRELHRRLNVPLGLIHSSWGGTIAEAWTSADALRENMPEFREAVEQVAAMKTNETEAEFQARVEAWWHKIDSNSSSKSSSDLDDSSWKQMTLPQYWEKVQELANFDGVVWFRRTFELPAGESFSDAKLDLGPIDDSDTTWVNGTQVGATNGWNLHRNYTVPGKLLRPGKNTIAIRVMDTGVGGGIYGADHPMALHLTDEKSLPLHGAWSYDAGPALSEMPRYPQRVNNNPNVPTVLHNAMLRPLQPYGIRGAIWYQGESNAGRAMQYRRLLPTMINDWRDGFEQPEFPFLVVQLANFMQQQTAPVQSGWAELREAQALTAKRMKNVGLAVITDIGEANDIHPRNKQDVGKRLALQALSMTYKKDLVHSGPTMKDMSVVGDALHIHFENVGSGLAIKNGNELKGFAIAEVEGEFQWAQAKIEGDAVILRHPALAEPLRVRYNWANNPIGNLFNAEGLPAAPFRTDVPPTR